MADLKPFPALLPKPDMAHRICELPYDVMTSEEARALAADNPWSFLHVSKPEIDLPDETYPYSPEVYAKGAENFARLIRQGALSPSNHAALYLYRQSTGAHSQLGLVAAASCSEYDRDLIKRHELTRPDKEDDRVRHIEVLQAQTGPAFLAYRAVPELDQFCARLAQAQSHVDFTAPDGVRHTSWILSDAGTIQTILGHFNRVPALYIADGHHRTAAASRVAAKRQGAGSSAHFLAVLFPHDQLQILPYNRALRDLHGRTPSQLLGDLESVFVIQPATTPSPGRKHELCLFLEGRWLSLVFRPQYTAGGDLLETLDVNLLQKHVLDPLLGIDNPRTSQRIAFVGGIRGTGELEKLVSSGTYACAFSLFPTRMEDLMAIADRGGIMPPKSTWFEPKLRDGMFCHLLDTTSY